MGSGWEGRAHPVARKATAPTTNGAIRLFGRFIVGSSRPLIPVAEELDRHPNRPSRDPGGTYDVNDPSPPRKVVVGDQVVREPDVAHEEPPRLVPVPRRPLNPGHLPSTDPLSPTNPYVSYLKSSQPPREWSLALTHPPECGLRTRPEGLEITVGDDVLVLAGTLAAPDRDSMDDRLAFTAGRGASRPITGS